MNEPRTMKEARKLVKEELKAQGIKISHVDVREINTAAKALVVKGVGMSEKELIERRFKKLLKEAWKAGFTWAQVASLLDRCYREDH